MLVAALCMGVYVWYTYQTLGDDAKEGRVKESGETS